MGAVAGMVGLAGGAGGTGFSGPSLAPVQAGNSPQDVRAAQGGVQNSLAAQQALLQALQGQNGLGAQTSALNAQQDLASLLAANNGAQNQGAVYNQMQDLANQLSLAGGLRAQEQALAGQTSLNTRLAGANGVGTQGAAIQGLQGVGEQQAATAATLQGIANGTGPNPAQAAFNQQTAENVAHTGALLAGQRGASANAGALANRIAREGARIQQQAVGQNAERQAQQQLAALGALGQNQMGQAATQQAIGALGTTQAGQEQVGLSNQALQGATQLGQQQQQLGQLGSQASQQVGQQLQALNLQGGQANVLGNQQILGTQALTGANLQNTAQQQAALSALNNANVSNQGNVNAANAELAGNTMGARNAILGGVANAAGAALFGGAAQRKAEGGEIDAPNNGPKSKFGQFYMNMSQGGLSEMGGAVIAENPSQKAVKSGDSYSNDKIPTMLSEGEVVIPRSVMMSKDPARASADFVRKVIAKRKVKAV